MDYSTYVRENRADLEAAFAAREEHDMRFDEFCQYEYQAYLREHGY